MIFMLLTREGSSVIEKTLIRERLSAPPGYVAREVDEETFNRVRDSLLMDMETRSGPYAWEFSGDVPVKRADDRPRLVVTAPDVMQEGDVSIRFDVQNAREQKLSLSLELALLVWIDGEGPWRKMLSIVDGTATVKPALRPGLYKLELRSDQAKLEGKTEFEVAEVWT